MFVDEYEAKIQICTKCEYLKELRVLGLKIPICGECKCPIKRKCAIGTCPKNKW
jgi:hypothetical protein